jgi:tetrahydromethanopterin S-methyltransferase subunit E
MSDNTQTSQNSNTDLQRDIDGLHDIIQQLSRLYVAVGILVVLAIINLFVIHWLAALAVGAIAGGIAYYIYSRTSKLRAQLAEKEQQQANG